MFRQIKSILKTARHRPFPMSLHASKCAMISYSQFGEDLIASSILGFERTDVHFLDIGCFEPIKYSNTYLFYCRGGRGTCIDPNSGLKKSWSRYRPEDRFVNMCVGSENKESVPYTGDEGACNAVASERSERTVDVGQVSISSVVSSLKGSHLDLVSIDVEGMEEAILQSWPFQTCRPSVFIVEDFDAVSMNSATAKILLSNGYKLRSWARISAIWVSDQF